MLTRVEEDECCAVFIVEANDVGELADVRWSRGREGKASDLLANEESRDWNKSLAWLWWAVVVLWE